MADQSITSSRLSTSKAENDEWHLGTEGWAHGIRKGPVFSVHVSFNEEEQLPLH